MPTLTIQLPGLPPVAHVLREETITIGRMKGSTIVLDDTSVSLMHAKITRSKEGEYFLKDLNSTNGTLLNGQVVREVKLQDLDQICFADVLAQFHADAVTPVKPITPLVPVLTNPTPTTAPATIQAGTLTPPPKPATASQPVGASSDTNRQRRATHAPAGSGVMRWADRAVPILGGVAAVLVVSIVVWKLFLSNPKASELADNGSSGAVTKADVKPDTGKPKGKDAGSSTTKTTSKPDNANITRLVLGLKDNDVEERRRAARTLQTMGMEAKEAAGPLLGALKDSDEEVQTYAAVTLVNVKAYDKQVIPILVRTVKHENATLRAIACLSLAVIPYEPDDKKTVIPVLAVAAANDDDEEVRKAAYSALTIVAPDIVAKANEKQ